MKSTKEMLTEYSPMVADFSRLPSIQEILSDLMGKIQGCDSVESVLRIRKDVILDLKKQVFDLKINALAQAAVASIEEQVKVAQKIFEPRLPSSSDFKTAEDRDLSVVDDPDLRETLRQMNETHRTIMGALARIQALMDEQKKTMLNITESLNANTIMKIKKFEQRAFKVPWSHRIEWTYLLLARKGIQFAVVAIVVEKLLETALKKNLPELLEHLRLHPAEFVVEAVVTVVIFLFGGCVERLIDERATRRYKRSLISLVMHRSTTLWTTYNALVKVASQAQEKLRQLKAAAAEMAKLAGAMNAKSADD